MNELQIYSPLQHMALEIFFKFKLKVWFQGRSGPLTFVNAPYRVGFTTAKLLKSGQYQKILKTSALALQYFLVLATF